MGPMEQQAADRLEAARLESNARVEDARQNLEAARLVFREEIAAERRKFEEGRAAVDAEEAAALEEARVLCILQMRCYVVF